MMCLMSISILPFRKFVLRQMVFDPSEGSYFFVNGLDGCVADILVHMVDIKSIKLTRMLNRAVRINVVVHFANLIGFIDLYLFPPF